MSLLGELQRRNVFRVATFYVVAGWVLLQAGDLLFDALGVPPWAIKLLLGFLLLGFPLALVFAWAYELTPEGLKREHQVDPDASITALTARWSWTPERSRSAAKHCVLWVAGWVLSDRPHAAKSA